MNIERCFKLMNRLAGYLAVVSVFLCSTGLLDQTKMQIAIVAFYCLFWLCCVSGYNFVKILAYLNFGRILAVNLILRHNSA